jgi:intraflagellar transport protein 122
MEATIKHIKVVSGPPKKESLIVGLQNGVVCRIFIDNSFPVVMVK